MAGFFLYIRFSDLLSPQRPIKSFFRKEFIVCALLDNVSFFHDIDRVRMHHCRKTVSNQDRDKSFFVMRYFFNRFRNFCFDKTIQRACCLIKDQYIRIA